MVVKISYTKRMAYQRPCEDCWHSHGFVLVSLTCKLQHQWQTSRICFTMKRKSLKSQLKWTKSQISKIYLRQTWSMIKLRRLTYPRNSIIKMAPSVFQRRHISPLPAWKIWTNQRHHHLKVRAPAPTHVYLFADFFYLNKTTLTSVRSLKLVSFKTLCIVH